MFGDEREKGAEKRLIVYYERIIFGRAQRAI
jgi:hypothetical protein